MCGICGVGGPAGSAVDPPVESAVARMSVTMARRGPDAEGAWSSPDARVRFGFRRLAVIDPSPAGNQPMVGADGRSALVMNGEIYNYRELKAELASHGRRFGSHADSEVLLAALEQWGLDALDRLNGMFAFAWYDGERRTLVLARDHAGIKPLYWSADAATGRLAFASRYDALLAAPWIRTRAMRPDVLHLYLRLHHIPAPYALIEGTHQLAPGHVLVSHGDGRLELRRWWRLPTDPEPDLRGAAAEETLAGALDRAVRRNRIADVPLGVFLSGGVDSPLVSAIAREQAGDSLEAFTIANQGWAQDEGPDAERYARALGLRLCRHEATAEEALAAVADVREAQYEPFADFSIIPTLMVSRVARSRVTVALSGDGGDELCFGYERPRSLLRTGDEFRWPWPVRAFRYAVRRAIARGARPSDVPLHRSAGEYYFAVNSRMSERDARLVAPGIRALPSDFALYDAGPYRSPLGLANFTRRAEFEGQLQRGLKKVDMASMHHSLEVRVPMLDREVIDAAIRIDPFEQMRGGERKRVLRDILARHVPREIIPSPKRGFAVPLGDWLRGPLRPVAEAALTSPALLESGAFDRNGLQRYWQRHFARAEDAKWGIWGLLSLAWWLERNA